LYLSVRITNLTVPEKSSRSVLTSHIYLDGNNLTVLMIHIEH